MKKICITGASGFVGQNLCDKLIKLNRNIIGTVRNLDTVSMVNNFECISVGDIGAETNWSNALKNVNCVIHCAGKTHSINEDKKDIDFYRLVNIEGTKRLAEQAANLGVKRLIFLSSVKINGESTGNIGNNKIFTNNDLPDPQNDYAISKFEAEKKLWEISLKTGLEVVVLRLPIVYGYGVKGNLLSLIKLINSGIPLPFSFINNKRSLIGIDNLVDIIIRCIDCSKASGKTFLVSDSEDLSTPNLIRYIASAMGRSARLFPFPILLINFFGFVIGKSKEVDRLTGSLQVDSDFTRKTLNWSPPISVQEGIKRMIKKNDPII
jgi:nucleoside-diphosphate-sugar epimerase